MGYILLVLTAMQVGLSTDMLRESAAFQAASSGFTLFAILVVLGLLLVDIALLVLFNALYMLSACKKQRKGHLHPKNRLELSVCDIARLVLANSSN